MTTITKKDKKQYRFKNGHKDVRIDSRVFEVAYQIADKQQESATALINKRLLEAFGIDI